MPRYIRLDIDRLLELAAMQGDLAEVKVLLRRGADPRGNSSHALRMALLRGHAKVAEALLKGGAELDDLPLPGAPDLRNLVAAITDRGHMAVLRLLERYGVVKLLKERR